VVQAQGIIHDADASKRALHEISRAGRLTLFGQAEEHESFLRHLSAEVARERGGRVVYEKLGSRENHWLDSTALALLAWRVSEPAAADPLREVATETMTPGETDETMTAGDPNLSSSPGRPSMTTTPARPRSRGVVRRIVRVSR